MGGSPLIDEFDEVARLSGYKDIKRRSAFHALNEKIVARHIAGELGKELKDINVITVHLGSGISVTAQKHGRCVDNTFGSGGDGPFSPERCGRLPVLELLKHLEQRKETDIKRFLQKASGLVSYLGTNDVLEIEKRMGNGDQEARNALDGIKLYGRKGSGGLCDHMRMESGCNRNHRAIAKSKIYYKQP